MLALMNNQQQRVHWTQHRLKRLAWLSLIADQSQSGIESSSSLAKWAPVEA